MVLLDYLTIIVFAAGIMLAGLSFSKTGKNMKSFFAADGAIPWWLSGVSLYMGFHSAGTFVVWGSIAYTHGWVAITIQLTMCLAGFIIAFFVAPRWRRTHALTAAEYISDRLGAKTQKVYTFLFLFTAMFSSGSFLYPIAKIVEVSTGLDLSVCIIALGVISILYVSVGGLWAVLVTDSLQFLVLIAAVIIVIPFAFHQIGGVENLIAKAPENFFNFTHGEYTWTFIIAFFIANTVYLGGNWSFIQRYTSVKTPKDAKKMTLLFSTLYLVSPLLWMLPSMIYRIYNPELVGLEGEGAFLLMCKTALPVGLLGMMVAGLIFATASSLNGSLNISAGVITNDIYKRLKPDSTNKQQMIIARLATIIFGTIAVLIALSIPKIGGIVNFVISFNAITTSPLYLPVIWSLFSKRQTGKSVLTISIAGLIINLTLKFIIPLIADFELARDEEMLVGVIVPAVLIIISEIYFKFSTNINKDYELFTEKIALKAQNEIKIDKREAFVSVNSANVFALKVLGIGCVLIGIVFGLLGIQSAAGSAVVMVVSALIVVFGIVILYGNHKLKKIKIEKY